MTTHALEHPRGAHLPAAFTRQVRWLAAGFAVGFLVPYTREHLAVSAILLSSPYLLASLCALGLLLRRRPTFHFSARIRRLGVVS